MTRFLNSGYRDPSLHWVTACSVLQFVVFCYLLAVRLVFSCWVDFVKVLYLCTCNCTTVLYCTVVVLFCSLLRFVFRRVLLSYCVLSRCGLCWAFVALVAWRSNVVLIASGCFSRLEFGSICAACMFFVISQHWLVVLWGREGRLLRGVTEKTPQQPGLCYYLNCSKTRGLL